MNSEKRGENTLWISADIEGYLTGCECPDGESAGMSAVALYLDENRDSDSQPLLDAGGMRESERSDLLLERFIDEAILDMEYSGLIAVSSDLRDGAAEYRKRRKRVPLANAGQFRRTLLGMGIPGRPKPLIIESADIRIAVAGFSAAAERARVLERNMQGFRPIVDPASVVDALSDADADIRILVVRGGAEDVNFPMASVDLIVFTGENSPAADMPGGGRIGGHSETKDLQEIPWLSLAARGNGLARVDFSPPPDADVEIEIIALERGYSEESPRILELGESFMEALTEQALAAAAQARGERYTGEAAEPARDAVSATYWYPYGCKECDVFLQDELPGLEDEFNTGIAVIEKNSSDPDVFNALLAELSERGVVLQALPVLLLDNNVYQGNQEIHNAVAGYLKSGESYSSSGIREQVSGPVRWEPGAVILAGLLDGVNPCAFSAMVFLISALAAAGGSRKRMLLVGFIYAAGVFVTYTLVGAGLLGGLRQIVLGSNLRRILEYVFSGLLLVLALLSVVDGFRLSRGRGDLLLKLPEKLSGKIHGLIRNELRDGAALGASFVLGAMVALLELGCTGQVYLPTLSWMISRGRGSAAWAWLLLYNLAFIVPLMVVFVLSFRGIRAVQMAKLFRSRGAIIKYATAGLFLVLAVLVLYS